RCALGEPNAEGLGRATKVIDELCSDSDENVARAKKLEMLLGGLRSMLDRMEQLWVEACKTSQVPGVMSIVFLPALRDELQLARVGYEDLVPERFEEMSHPPRVHSGLDGNALPADPVEQNRERCAAR
ncbi:MAG TPA: hypothetical protein VNA04_02930, partial [Thermoanaerobaculia bacterium]|nr:hypothetical protein [Thermoanaerobaculia bacterium]